MPGAPTLAQVHACLADAYAGEPFVEVVSLAESAGVKTLDPQGLKRQPTACASSCSAMRRTAKARLVALLDNLGKGASGAAVQNLNLSLGLEETTGL